MSHMFYHHTDVIATLLAEPCYYLRLAKIRRTFFFKLDNRQFLQEGSSMNRVSRDEYVMGLNMMHNFEFWSQWSFSLGILDRTES